MLTATTKSLLSPIADAVSQLIVITAQAELNESPIPDLRDVAHLVAQHVYSLAEIGHGLIDPAALAAETRGNVDVTKLLKEMTDACAEVRAAGDLLVDVTQSLASDPFSAPGRKLLVEATKGILQGTQRILNTYDDSEIQKSLVVARALIDQSKLIATILASDLDAPPVIKSLLDNARTFAQQSLFLFHLIHARIPELLSPPIQRALSHHSTALDRAAVGTIAALKYALAGSHQIVPSNLDLVKRQLKAHARACDGIVQYIVKDDMAEGATLGDIIEEEADDEEVLNYVGGLSSLASAAAGSRRSLVTTSKARIDPVRGRIKRYVQALETLAEGDELEQTSADAVAAAHQARADMESAPWAKNNKQPQLAAGLLEHAIHEAQGAPRELRELHAKRIQGIADHLARQVEVAAVTSQHAAIGAVLSALDQVSACAHDLDMLAACEGKVSDPEVMEAKADELQVAGQAAVQGLKDLGLVRAANQIQDSVPAVVSVARSTAEAAEDQMAQEANRAYLSHVLGELSGQVGEAKEQVVKSVSGDEVVLGLVSHIAENLQAIEASRAKGAATGNLDRVCASADKLGTGDFDSAAIDQFLANSSPVAKDMRALDLPETAASIEASAKILADAANALAEAKKSQDPAQIQAAQDLLDASLRNWNLTLANSRRTVAQKTNTDSTLGDLELCKEKAMALGGTSKAGFKDADQDFARATGNACQALTDLASLPTHVDQLATLAAQVSLTSRAAIDAADGGDSEKYKVLAAQRNAAINQFNAVVDKIEIHLAASTRERSLGSAILHLDHAQSSVPAIRSAAHGGNPNPVALNKFLHEASAAAQHLKAGGALGSSLELDTATSDVRAAVRDLQATDDDVNSRAHKFASSRLDVALEQWTATADKVRKQAVHQVYQTHVQGVVAELEAAKASVAALASESGHNRFKQSAVLAEQALSNIRMKEDAVALMEKAESVVDAAEELGVAKIGGNHDTQAAAEVKLQRLVHEWNRVVTKSQEGAKVAAPTEAVLNGFGTRAMEASESQPIQATGTSNLDRSQLLANDISSTPNVDAAVTDFTAATKSAISDLNQLDCSGAADVLACASDDVASASHAFLAQVAAHGPESAQVTSARKVLSFAVGHYNDAADKARSIVAQRQASKKLASALAKNRKVFQRLSTATDLEAIDEDTDEFTQSADAVALTLRGLGCGNAADRFVAFAPLVVASTRQAADSSLDQSTRQRRGALLDQWISTLVAVQEEADETQAQAQVGSALAALGRVKDAASELETATDTGVSAAKFALALKELYASMRANPALVGTADALKPASNAVVATANAVADLEAKGQRGTPEYATAKVNLDRACEQWTAAASKAHDDLAATMHQIAKSNATKTIEAANVSTSALAAVASQNGDSAASSFKQSANGTIQELQALGLVESARQVQKAVPQVLNAIQAVAAGAKGDDAIAQQAATQKLESAATEWNTALGLAKEEVVTAVPTQTVLSGLSARAVHTAQAINRPLQSAQQFSSASASASSLRANVGKMASVISGLVKAIQHEAENTDDPAYKCKLQNALATAQSLPATDMQKVQGFIADCGALVASHGGSTFPVVDSSSAPIPSDLLTLVRAPEKHMDESTTADVEERVEFKSAVSVIPVTVPNPISDSLANLAAEDVVIVEEEAPELLDEEEAKANPIKAVAQELIVQASRWSHQDNDLVATVTNVSQRLHDLAEAYKKHHSPQSQLSLLSSTKEIVGLCGNLQKLASQLAIACTDRRLRVELVAAANRLPTLSQQLKILASVRASAGPSDGDSERQLATVAQNLMVVVKDILVKSEAASIRVNQAVVAGNVGLAMIKFKRNLFKGRARRAAEMSTAAANGGNDSGDATAGSTASSKAKASGLKGLVVDAVVRSGTVTSLASTASPASATMFVNSPAGGNQEPAASPAAPAVSPTKPKGAFASLASVVKSSPPPASAPPAAPSATAATHCSSSLTSASPVKSLTTASATGPSLAKRTKSSETFNPASLLSAPPRSPSRPGA